MTAGLLIGLIGAATSHAENLLFYGNSFTNGLGSSDSVPNLVRDIATAAGHATPTIANAAVNGQDFTWHLANNTAPITTSLPAGETWDFAILQNFSTEPTHIGDLAAHRADSVTLYQTIASHSPDVVPVLYQTWARAPGHSYYSGATPNFPGGPSQMQQELHDGYELARQDIDNASSAGLTRVAEVGDRWEDANWDRLHAGDLYHAQNRGTLLAALEIYSTVYESPTSGIDLSGVLSGLSLTEYDGQFLAAIADGLDPPDPPGLPDNPRMKFDFGDLSHPNPNYNVVPSSAQDVADALDFSTGAPTGVGLTVTSTNGFHDNGSNTSGTTAPGAPASDYFDGDATNRNLFGHSSTFSGVPPRTFVEYTIDGLDPTRTYDFTFFASRMGVSDNRETQYDVIGENAGVDFLDPSGNTSEIAQVLDIRPNDAGEIVLQIQEGPNNVNGSGFFYLGSLDIATDLVGDYDGDGQVGLSDQAFWAGAYGATGFSMADGNADGVVDAADYTVWRDAYQLAQNAEESAESVPEPGAATLLVALLAAASSTTARRRAG